MAATDQAINNSARHAVFVQRFAGGLTKDFDEIIVRLRERITTILISGGNTDQLIGEITAAQEFIYSQYEDELNQALADFANNESSFELKDLGRLGLDDAKPPPTLWANVLTKPLEFIQSGDVKLLEPFIRDWSRAQINRVEKIIRSGVLNGLTHTEIAELIGKKGGDLATSLARNNKAMVRTAVNHVSNEARAATYRSNPDIIGHEWVAKIDARTSEICLSLDGREFIYATDSPILFPPAHINCRSTTAPIFRKEISA